MLNTIYCRQAGSIFKAVPAVASVAALALAAGLSASSAWADGGASGAGSTSPELNVVGTFDVPNDNMTADVWALGNYAYLGSFTQPDCSFDLTGVRIIDISDPANPTLAAFIPSRAGKRAIDVKVEHVETGHFNGEILVVTDELCAQFHPRLVSNGGPLVPGGPLVLGGPLVPGGGGLSIYDVTDPTKPKVLKRNFLLRQNNGIRNTFIYQQGDNAYILAVDDVDLRDLIIIDITNPRRPRVITRTGAPDWPALNFSEIDGASVFLHDVWAQENGFGKVIAYLSYWDAGLVLLDITDPANPVFLGDSTYPNPDKSGLPPEGNGHVAVPTADGSLVILGDEDQSKFLTLLDSTIGGPPPGDKVGSALFGPQPAADAFDLLTPGDVLSVADAFGCNAGDVAAAPGGSADIVLIQRGVCFFSTKAANAEAAGYDAYIVYNDAARGDGLIDMSSGTADVITIPGLFVGHTVGSAMAAEIMGSGIVTVVSVVAIADGEGFMRVIDVTDPMNMVQVGSYVTEGTLPPANALLAGTRSAHNVVVDGDRAYWAWNYNGIRVVEFSDCDVGDGFEGCTPTEVAHFGGGDFGPAKPDTNFWGVYLHDHPDGNTYILGSDRNSGLWIFDTP